ncbi:MAG: AraC family transcriptional regulator [Chitinophagia bacterium]|jgi:predicted transcriptional regulator YdeE|nr:AraC family transcriptional regulator [Chitinophagia bacterium]
MESVVENSIIITGISTRIEHPTHASKQMEELWQQFWKENLPSKVTGRFNNTIYTVYHEYAGDYTKPYTATIGYRINKIQDISNDLKVIVIPQQHYKVFTANGHLPGSVVAAWKNIWHSNLQRSYKFDFEIYDERAQNPQDAIVDIYIAVSE